MQIDAKKKVQLWVSHESLAIRTGEGEGEGEGEVRVRVRVRVRMRG